MQKPINPSNIKANWHLFLRRPVWSVVSSVELSQVFGVHLQTISNYKIRGILPPPVKHKALSGNKNYYRISTIRAWLEDKSEEQVAWEWASEMLPYDFPHLNTLGQLEYLVTGAYKLLELEKPLIPANFSV